MKEQEKRYVEKIVKEFSEKEETKLDKLRALNREARKGANIFAYVFGTIGTLVLGMGMSVAMQVILEDLMWVGIVVGLVGIFMVSVNYFIYKKLLEKGKNKYSRQILDLSEEILNK